MTEVILSLHWDCRPGHILLKFVLLKVVAIVLLLGVGSMGETRYGVCLSYDDSDLYDCDWYKFTLNSPASVSVTFTHTKASANGDWVVYLYKYTGNGGYSRVTDEDVYVSDGNYTFPTQGVSAGTYFVKVYGYSSACGRQYGVTVNYAVAAQKRQQL